jgi:hypothetical protein
MMARRFAIVALLTVAGGSGCCCAPCGPCGAGPCGPGGCGSPAGMYGGPLFPCLPRPMAWNGACNECDPCPGGPCGPCGLLPWLCRCLTGCKGCGDIYIHEWISDPPDCCDPCDNCNGQFTGNRACNVCCLGPCQRILSALHGYSYCPAPYCGPWRPLFPCLGARGCGHGGCGGCGVCGMDGMPAHGADIYYDGAMQGAMPQGAMPQSGAPRSAAPQEVTPRSTSQPATEGTSILDENWDVPKTRPEPGKPIHNAKQPPRSQTSGRYRPPGQQVAGRPQSVGTGVRRTNYQPYPANPPYPPNQQSSGMSGRYQE